MIEFTSNQTVVNRATQERIVVACIFLSVFKVFKFLHQNYKTTSMYVLTSVDTIFGNLDAIEKFIR